MLHVQGLHVLRLHQVVGVHKQPAADSQPERAAQAVPHRQPGTAVLKVYRERPPQPVMVPGVLKAGVLLILRHRSDPQRRQLQPVQRGQDSAGVQPAQVDGLNGNIFQGDGDLTFHGLDDPQSHIGVAHALAAPLHHGGQGGLAVRLTADDLPSEHRAGDARVIRAGLVKVRPDVHPLLKAVSLQVLDLQIAHNQVVVGNHAVHPQLIAVLCHHPALRRPDVGGEGPRRAENIFPQLG